MLKALLRRKSRLAPIDTAALPEGRRVYAIGDVHGRSDLLDELLEMIVADDRDRPAADTHIVFLGDLMDRGPDSSGVIDRAMLLSKARPDNVHFLMGNHEEVYLGAATGDEKLVRFFCKIGGRETILSYDITPQDYNELSMEDLAARMPELLPREHVEFVAGFKDRIVMGDYAFVHAGVRPGVPIEEQRPKDLRWIREEFILDEAAHDKLIVHGHTITDDVEECPNRIGIDTGAYLSGMLTALGLEGGERWYLKTGQ